MCEVRIVDCAPALVVVQQRQYQVGGLVLERTLYAERILAEHGGDLAPHRFHRPGRKDAHELRGGQRAVVVALDRQVRARIELARDGDGFAVVAHAPRRYVAVEFQMGRSVGKTLAHRESPPAEPLLVVLALALEELARLVEPGVRHQFEAIRQVSHHPVLYGSAARELLNSGTYPPYTTVRLFPARLPIRRMARATPGTIA